MQIEILKRKINLILIFVIFSTVCIPSAYAQDNAPRYPDEILVDTGELPTPDAIRELFENASNWEESHKDVKELSKQALIDLGSIAVPTLCENLSSRNVLKRVTVDEIIRAIGSPGNSSLVEYLDDEDWFVRRHAGYLVGDTCAAQELEDPYELGPLPEDVPSILGLRNALSDESDWHVAAAMIESLGKFRDPEQIDALAGFLVHEEQAIRLAAVKGIGYIPQQQAAVELIRAFGDELVNIRQAAVTSMSTETMGNLGFEALIGSMALSPAGMTGQQCAMETLSRYLDIVSTSDDPGIDAQRSRTFDSSQTLLAAASESSLWSLRGYTYTLISYTWHPDALEFLENQLDYEEHPFAIGKLHEAISRLEDGRPVAEE